VPVLCVLTYLVVGAAYVSAVPPWEAPDEPWHMAYAEVVASGRAPTLEDTYEAHQPPLAYVWLAWWLRLLDLDQLPRAPDNPWYPYAVSATWHVPGDPAVAWLRLLRTVAALPAAVVVALTWAAARVMAPRAAAPAAVAGMLAALWPQFVFISHAVNNDGWAVLCGSLLIYGVVAWTSGTGPLPRVAAALGLGAAMAPLIKLNVLAVVAAVPLAAVAVWASPSPAAGARLRWVWVPLAAVALGLAAAVLGLHAMWPATLALMAGEAATRGLVVDPALADPPLLLARLVALGESAWARFGWLNVDLPRGLRWASMAVLGASALGFARAWPGLPVPRRLAAAVVAATVGLAIAAAVKNLLVDPQPQGRLLFPAFSAMVLVVAVGAMAIVPARRRSGLAVCAAAVLLAVNAWVVTRLLPPAYEPARGPLPAIDVRIVPPQPVIVATLGRDVPAVRQTFRATRPGLRQAAVAAAGAAGPGDVRVLLWEGDRLVAHSSAAVAGLQGQPYTWLGVDMEPVADSSGRTYALELRVLRAGPGTRLDVWGGRGGVYPDGELALAAPAGTRGPGASTTASTSWVWLGGEGLDAVLVTAVR